MWLVTVDIGCQAPSQFELTYIHAKFYIQSLNSQTLPNLYSRFKYDLSCRFEFVSPLVLLPLLVKCGQVLLIKLIELCFWNVSTTSGLLGFEAVSNSHLSLLRICVQISPDVLPTPHGRPVDVFSAFTIIGGAFDAHTNAPEFFKESVNDRGELL